MRKVIQQLGIYKRDTFLCIGLTALEVIMEILLPFVTAIIIDQGWKQAILELSIGMARSWCSWRS